MQTPPSCKPPSAHRPRRSPRTRGGAPMSLVTENFSMYSLMSKRIRAASVSNSVLANALHSSVFPKSSPSSRSSNIEIASRTDTSGPKKEKRRNRPIFVGQTRARQPNLVHMRKSVQTMPISRTALPMAFTACFCPTTRAESVSAHDKFTKCPASISPRQTLEMKELLLLALHHVVDWNAG